MRFDEFQGNLMLLILDVFEEGEYLPDLWQDDLIVILLAQFVTDGEFVGSLHRLVEVATQPTEILLILTEEGGHFVQGLHASDSADVVELTDGIANHRTHVAVAFCLVQEEVVLLWSQPHFAYYCSFFHILQL